MISDLVNDNIIKIQSFISSKTHFKTADSNQPLILLDKNENKLGCSPKVILAIKQSLNNNINDYPDDSCHLLKEKLADHFKLNRSSFLVTNGSIEALNLIFKTFKVNSIVVPSPTYWAYETFAGIHDRNILRVPLEDDFSIDIHKLIDKAKRSGQSSVILCNPNNPTGKLVSGEDIAVLLESLESSLVVIDEAYAEFARTTSANLIRKYDNLIVVKSFSKSYGLAGLRIGYAVASEEITGFLSCSRMPFSVSSIAQIAATAALDDQEYHNYVINRIENIREILHQHLEAFDFLEPVSSKTNFVLTRLKNTAAVNLYRFLLSNGVVVRLFNQDLRLSDYIRISVGTEKDNQLLMSLFSRYHDLYQHAERDA